MKQMQRIFWQEMQTTRIQEIFSPGRINVIGEHIDYNGGPVFPTAIDIGTMLYYQERVDTKVCVYSANFPDDGVYSWELATATEKNGNRWDNFVKAMVVTLAQNGYPTKNGFNLYVEGNIPTGSGLSSSASLEVGVGVMLADLQGATISMLDIVKMAQAAENKYIGVNCGIMDMFAIGFGQKDKAMLLATDTLDMQYADFKLGTTAILILDTKHPRELADSKYNERREECDAALAILQAHYPIKLLCDLTVTDLPQVKQLLADYSLLYKRVQHVVTEQARVLATVAAMEAGDLAAIGVLLNASHSSLQHDYEVTGEALDTIVAIAQEQTGVLGARMTGAGFGGCAIALVEQGAIASVQETIAKEYTEKLGITPAFYIAHTAEGTRII